MDDMEAVWVVGNEYHGSTFDKRGLNGTSVPARLVREPQNRFDRNAVGVHVGRSQVGNLSEARAAKIARWVDSLGGTFNTTLTYRDGGADVMVPAPWVETPKEERVSLQLSTKYQEELRTLGVGSHKCKVRADGEQLSVEVDGTVVGRLYPKKLEQSTLDKIVHNRQQNLVIDNSAYSEGLYARIVVPASKASAPTFSPTGQSAAVSQPTVEEPSIGSFVRGLFSRR